MPSGITDHCVDGYYAKKKYIDEVVNLDLHAITKLRSDADGVLLYTGPHPKRRGARRKYAGKVNFQDMSRFEDLGTREDEPHLHLYSAVVWHKPLKRRLRLVVLLNRKDPAQPRFIVRGSTDPDLHGHKLIDLYAARFQIEFLFRDSQQCTGLLDCQARSIGLRFSFQCRARNAQSRARCGLEYTTGPGTTRLLDGQLEAVSMQRAIARCMYGEVRSCPDLGEKACLL